MTSTTRVAATRKRQREAGLVRVEVLVPVGLEKQARKYAAALRLAVRMGYTIPAAREEAGNPQDSYT